MTTRSGTNIPEDERKTKRVQTRVHENVDARLAVRSSARAVSASSVLRETIEGSWWAILSEESIADSIKPEVVNNKVDLVATIKINRNIDVFTASFPELKNAVSFHRSHEAFSRAFKDKDPPYEGSPARVSLEKMSVFDPYKLIIDGASFDITLIQPESRDNLFGLIAACDEGPSVHLLKLVSELRMLISGASEVFGVTTSMEALAIRWIRWRITEGWTKSFGSRLCKHLDQAFDESVRTMAAAVCEMWSLKYADKLAARDCA